MSAVLFLPETALYLLLCLLVPGTRAVLALNAVVNLVLLYVVLRAGAGVIVPHTTRGRQVGGAVLAFGALSALSLLDSSAAWDSGELPSLISTSTYYSATLLAMLVSVPLAAGAALNRTAERRRSLLLLAGVTTVSTLTNPLHLGWTVVPLTVVLLLVWGRRMVTTQAALGTGAALWAAAALGLLLRVPLSSFIPRDTASYADPGQALHVLFGFYLRVTAQQASTPAGAISLAGAAALIVLTAILHRRALTAKNARLAIAAAFGWVAPMVVVIGAVALGTHAYRYLQPLYFAPLLGLLALPAMLGTRLRRPSRSHLVHRLAVMVVAASVVVSLTAGAAISTAVSRTDPSINCLTGWITASHRVGAGRFLTIRGPKAYLQDPRQLVQVDAQFRAYLALVNRDDYRVAHVSFIVRDSTTPAPVPPVAPGGPPPTSIRCGRYTITDYHRAVLAIGPATTEYDP